MLLEAIKTLGESYALTNTVAVSPNDFPDASKDRCVVVSVRPVQQGTTYKALWSDFGFQKDL